MCPGFDKLSPNGGSELSPNGGSELSPSDRSEFSLTGESELLHTRSMILSPNSPCGRISKTASASTYANQFSMPPPRYGPR